MHKKIGRSLLLFALLLTLLTAGFFLFKPLQGISAAQSDDHVPNAVFANGTPSDSLVYLPIAIHGDSFRTIFGYENGSINSRTVGKGTMGHCLSYRAIKLKLN